MQTLKVRIADNDDFPDILGFVEANLSATLPLPSVQSLAEALAKGNVYVAHVGGHLAACAGLFRVAVGCLSERSDGDDVEIYEMACSRVISLAGGLSPIPLQRILIWVRTIGILTSNGRLGSLRRPVCIISAVLDEARRSLGNLSDAGLRPLLEVPRWLALEGRTWQGGSNVRYQYVTSGAISAHAAGLLSLATNGTLTREAGPGLETFDVELDLPWLDWAGAHVDALASSVVIPNVVGVPPFRRVGNGHLV